MDAHDYSQLSEDFQRIEKAIQFIEENFKSQPTLDQMARSFISASIISTGCSSGGLG